MKVYCLLKVFRFSKLTMMMSWSSFTIKMFINTSERRPTSTHNVASIVVLGFGTVGERNEQFVIILGIVETLLSDLFWRSK